MIQNSIPIVPVKPNLNDAVNMAVRQIGGFLDRFNPGWQVTQPDEAGIVATMWLSRIEGFHEDDDFVHLVRDFLTYVASDGERTLVSDRIALYFSRFMPSYGAACIFCQMVNDDATWSDVRAFMHSQAYGNAQQYVETFDAKAAQKKAQKESDAWVDILKGNEPPAPGVQEAFVDENGMYGARATDVPIVPPLPKTETATVVAEEAEENPAHGLGRLPEIKPIVVPAFVLMAAAAAQQDDFQKHRDAMAKRNIVVIPNISAPAKVKPNTLNCQRAKQLQKNRENGAKCERDGYVLMEKELNYRSLTVPPDGQGLDGLFEKQMPMNEPDSMPEVVQHPVPGSKLVFIPEAMRPPKPRYNYTATASGISTYPQFVVWEAKDSSKAFSPTDTDGIKKQATQQLRDTCDGTQMSEDWVKADRIQQALARSKMTVDEQNQKYTEVRKNGYARWIFMCSPGPIGSSSKLYVLIDIALSGMDVGDGSKSTKPVQPPSGKKSY